MEQLIDEHRDRLVNMKRATLNSGLSGNAYYRSLELRENTEHTMHTLGGQAGQTGEHAITVQKTRQFSATTITTTAA